jgi:hypothetical protein
MYPFTYENSRKRKAGWNNQERAHLRTDRSNKKFNPHKLRKHKTNPWKPEQSVRDYNLCHGV